MLWSTDSYQNYVIRWQVSHDWSAGSDLQLTEVTLWYSTNPRLGKLYFRKTLKTSRELCFWPWLNLYIKLILWTVYVNVGEFGGTGGFVIDDETATNNENKANDENHGENKNALTATISLACLEIRVRNEEAINSTRNRIYSLKVFCFQLYRRRYLLFVSELI